jgi:hypothetical protein
MDFLDISSLGVAYRYVVKIEQKFKQQVSESLGLQICHNKSMEKETLTHRTRDKERRSISRKSVQAIGKEG